MYNDCFGLLCNKLVLYEVSKTFYFKAKRTGLLLFGCKVWGAGTKALNREVKRGFKLCSFSLLLTNNNTISLFFSLSNICCRFTVERDHTRAYAASTMHPILMIYNWWRRGNVVAAVVVVVVWLHLWFSPPAMTLCGIETLSNKCWH